MTRFCCFRFVIRMFYGSKVLGIFKSVSHGSNQGWYVSRLDDYVFRYVMEYIYYRINQ